MEAIADPKVQGVVCHVAFFNRSYYPDQTATGQLLTDLCEDLVREHGCRVTVVTAETPVAFAGSRGLLEKCGFVLTGTRSDPEEGELALYARTSL